MYSVHIERDRSAASVSAIIRGECHTLLMFTLLCFFAHLGIQLNLGNDDFLISPYDYIVGSLRGTPIKVCSGNPLHPKECYPDEIGRIFKAGDIIDFTWGMSSHRGILIFAIVPAE